MSPPTQTLSPGEPGPGSSPLEWAFSQLGVREEGAPNRGRQVDKYLRSVGLEPDQCPNPEKGYAWCAAFVHWCCEQAGVWCPRTGLVRRLADLGNNHRVIEAETGDVFVHRNDDGTGHCGFVVRRLPSGDYETIEGNTNGAGSREGNMVAIRQRHPDYIDGFLRFG